MTALADEFAHDPKRWSALRYTLFGLLLIIGLFGGMGYWSVATEIHGAVIAQGELRVESNSKPVQHHEGGIIGAIFVRDGDEVKAGDPLVRLDKTTQEANRSIVDTRLIEFGAQRARLMAERDEESRVEFPDEVLRRAAVDPEVQIVVIDQRKLFNARLESYRQQLAQLSERVGQLENGIDASKSRRVGFDSQLSSIREELVIQQRLLDRGLTTRTRLQQFRREEARIVGEIGALEAEEARLQRQIQETEIERTRLRETRREEALAQLREVETTLAELKQRLIVADDALSKIELRAPQNGIVQDMTVFAPGAVVGPGEPIMMIVPTTDRLILEARVEPSKRDDVNIGGEARVRFVAFNQRTTPELIGSVHKISADRKLDEAQGFSYYQVEILVPEEERNRLGEENELVPGLPAEIYIQTEKRTPLNYLLKPLTDNFNRALRDD